jgi:hypothetical protein
MAYSALLLAYTLFVVGVGFFPESSQVRKPSLNSHRILIFGLINGHHGANERRIEARCLTRRKGRIVRGWKGTRSQTRREPTAAAESIQTGAGAGAGPRA